MKMTDNYMDENYTFTKDTIVNNTADSSLTYEFYSKNNLNELLSSVLEFIQASGYPYVAKLIAVKDNGEEHASDEEIDENVIEILSQIIEDMDMAKKQKNKPTIQNNLVETKISSSSGANCWSKYLNKNPAMKQWADANPAMAAQNQKRFDDC